MPLEPAEQLVEGARLLEPLLASNGFVFSIERSGKASGGLFASGSYCRENRRLELHFRRGLGIVLFHIGDASLDVKTYWRLLDVAKRSEFLHCKMDGTLDGFERLRIDLERFAGDFLHGDGLQFTELANKFEADPDMFSGISGLT